MNKKSKKKAVTFYHLSAVIDGMITDLEELKSLSSELLEKFDNVPLCWLYVQEEDRLNPNADVVRHIADIRERFFWGAEIDCTTCISVIK